MIPVQRPWRGVRPPANQPTGDLASTAGDRV